MKAMALLFIVQTFVDMIDVLNDRAIPTSSSPSTAKDKGDDDAGESNASGPAR